MPILKTTHALLTILYIVVTPETSQPETDPLKASAFSNMPYIVVAEDTFQLERSALKTVA